jgi:5-methylcytosine-specific restriction protein A
MKFGYAQELRFGTANGAYSIVTGRENIDSQITITDYESELFLEYFGKENILIGNVQSDRSKAIKSFRHYPSGIEIALNVVYPKPDKPELRLYISLNAGFKPDGGDVWFTFIKDASIWIGSMAEMTWRSGLSVLSDDDFDSLYQESLDESNTDRLRRIKGHDVYARDRRVALESIDAAGHLCEYDDSHSLFVSRFNNKPFLEAHHLIPISLQSKFSRSLDTTQNVFSLCPCCHRAVHHAETGVARDILEKLSTRRDVLDLYSITAPDLYGFYAVEEITR